MRTIESEGWGAVWRRDMAAYDPASVIAAVDEESVSVRCEKHTAYLDEHVGDLAGKRTVEMGRCDAIYSLIFARLGARATLLDYSPEALTLAASNLRALALEGE